jgi:hypothetical protein
MGICRVSRRPGWEDRNELEQRGGADCEIHKGIEQEVTEVTEKGEDGKSDPHEFYDFAFLRYLCCLMLKFLILLSASF